MATIVNEARDAYIMHFTDDEIKREFQAMMSVLMVIANLPAGVAIVHDSEDAILEARAILNRLDVPWQGNRVNP